jgi:hypothetical protein
MVITTMSEPSDLYLTRKLTNEEVVEAMRAMPAFLQRYFDKSILKAMYGYGCNLHPQLCYSVMEVGVSCVGKFIEDSLKQKIVDPGGSDFIIEVPEQQLIIKFCHEGDIHTSGTSLEAQEALWSTSPFSNFSLLRAPGIKEPDQIQS